MEIAMAALTEKVGEGLWRWSVWIEYSLIEEIEEVVYTLDSSFSKPVRRSKDRSSSFKIEDTASESFTVFAQIKAVEGVTVRLEKELILSGVTEDTLVKEGAADLFQVVEKKPIILCVDDDTSILEALVQDIRRNYRNFRILRAASGVAALDILHQLKGRGETVALIITDQRMPNMTGTKFLVPASKMYPRAKTALQTAYADTEAAIQAINESKVDYYINKPWDPPQEKLYPILDELLADWQPRKTKRFEAS